MKYIKKLNEYPIIVLALNIGKIWQLIEWIYKILNHKIPVSMNIEMDSILYVFVTIMLWLILRAFFRLESKLDLSISVSAIVTEIRTKRAFYHTMLPLTIYNVPNETQDEFFWRSKDGMYVKQFIDEYLEVRHVLIESMKDKSANDIEKLLRDFYPQYIIDYAIGKS